MSVIVESTPDIITKPPRKSVSAHKLNYSGRKQSGDTEKMVKKTSIVRRKKNVIGANPNFRHSVHDISGALTELSLTEEVAAQTGQQNNTTNQQQQNINKDHHPPEKTRLRRARSFHVSEDHGHQNISLKERSEILKQYIANKLNIELETLENDLNSDQVPKCDLKDSSLPIHEAVMHRYEKGTIKELSLLLLKNECLNIEQQNSDGHTPLQFAVSLELPDVVKLLIAFGATVHCKDNYGESPLRYAVDNGDFEMASLLISHGANASMVQNGF